MANPILIHISCLCLFFLINIIALYILRSKMLFSITMLSGVFSLFCALLYIILGAPDVALTESAVGAGVYTILSLLTIYAVKHDSYGKVRSIPTLAITKHQEKGGNYHYKYAIFIMLCTLFVIFCIGLFQFPIFGNPDNPPINKTYFTYVEDSFSSYDVPNMVTMVLGNFRGVDTLYETLVILIASLIVMTIIKQPKDNTNNTSK